MNPLARLADKRVLITGTGGGQGAAAQRLFAQHGARIVGCDFQPGSAETSAEELRDQGCDVSGYTVDLTDPSAAAGWVHEAAAGLGGIDVLYNNAAGARFAPFAEMDYELWNWVLRAELDIVFHTTRAAWEHLAAGGGSLINTASYSALQAIEPLAQVAHAAAKGGVLSMTRALAGEGARHGIRANSISPGFIRSPATDRNVDSEGRAWQVGNTLLHRPGAVADIAYMALYLASDEASWVTGQNMIIDGGATAGWRDDNETERLRVKRAAAGRVAAVRTDHDALINRPDTDQSAAQSFGTTTHPTPSLDDLEYRTVPVADGVELHVALTGGNGRPIVLLHGFPQTSRSWHGVIPALAAAGHRVVAIDYRGAGDSSRPVDGYDKRTMATDVRTALQATLGTATGAVLVGHDIGLMITAAYLLAFRGELAGAVLIDAPIPGTTGFDTLRQDQRLWHFGFHNSAGMAELLTAGREADYVRSFIGGRLPRPDAVSPSEIQAAAAAYARPGALKAGFELYRTFDDDARFVRSEIDNAGRVSTPVLGVGGSLSLSCPHMAAMIGEITTDSRFSAVPQSGHWVPDEAPDALGELILRFIDEEINHARTF